MVEPAQARQRNQTGIRKGLWLERPSIRCVFVQGVVSAVLLVIAHLIADQAAKMLLIHRDDMVEDFAAATSIHLSAVPFCHGA